MDIDKRIKDLTERLAYVRDVFGPKENDNVRLLETKLNEHLARSRGLPVPEQLRRLVQLEDLFDFLEKKLEAELTAMDTVRIVRHPQRICLMDILENVYDNYTEIAGQDEFSIDPSVVIARAYVTRKVGTKVYNQSVMVIGQEKGHGQEFRNGGSVKPWGNAKALHYMKVAETENIPIHAYVFTPGSFPIEDYPGAAQQIARNLYEMSQLKTPIVAVFSEGGSGGAEAVGLADRRLMLSHGYYSVISPEGAAAIEGRLRGGDRATPERCARQLCITAQDNLRMGYVDRVLQEPPLGARPHHYEFFKRLRHEIIWATNEVVGSVKGMKLFRSLALRRMTRSQASDAEAVFLRWSLSAGAKERLIDRRWRKFREMSTQAYLDRRGVLKKASAKIQDLAWSTHSTLRYDFVGKALRRVDTVKEEFQAEAYLLKEKVGKYKHEFKRKLGLPEPEVEVDEATRQQLTGLSRPEQGRRIKSDRWRWVSPRAREDRAVTCPNAPSYGCLDLWAPDLFGEFAGACAFCGHHFPMEYEWYLYNVFDFPNAFEFNAEIESANPLNYEGFDLKVEHAKKKTGLKSACITFETEIEGVKTVVAVLVAPFRGGTVGAAEGEKFIRAAERAKKKHYPFIAYVHGTAGIRIQEGVNGVIQMPRCTMAVRRYIEAGGLYLVLYDTNSYAGPVASFLGCSPYQFAIRSSNIGFAGPGVIRETTGMDVPPNYHLAYLALSRGHIQGIWDRREAKKNLHQALLTVGGRNLYYR
ncbi:MAG: acetyl-CoA carboxylase carboxyl transferase subunit alpha/beta [Desulfovibrionaceae bacterium]